MAFAQLKIRLGALLMLLAVAMALLAFLAARRLEATAASLETVFNDRVVCLQQLHTVSETFGQAIPSTFRKVRAGSVSPLDARLSVISGRGIARQQWLAYRQTYLTVKEAQLAAAADGLLRAADEASAHGQALLEQNASAAELDSFMNGELPRAADPLIAALDELVANEYKSVDANQRPFGFVSARNFFGMDINPFAVDIAKVTMTGPISRFSKQLGHSIA